MFEEEVQIDTPKGGSGEYFPSLEHDGIFELEL
jgi:hypothetical protein